MSKIYVIWCTALCPKKKKQTYINGALTSGGQGTVLRAFWDVLPGYNSSLALTKFSTSFLDQLISFHWQSSM